MQNEESACAGVSRYVTIFYNHLSVEVRIVAVVMQNAVIARDGVSRYVERAIASYEHKCNYYYFAMSPISII